MSMWNCQQTDGRQSTLMSTPSPPTRCCGQQAHFIQTNIRRGLFTVAPHASDIVTLAGNYGACHVVGKGTSTPLMVRLSPALQRHLAEVEVVTATEARTVVQVHGVPAGGDLLVVDGPLRGRQHLAHALGYIMSHRWAPAGIGIAGTCGCLVRP